MLYLAIAPVLQVMREGSGAGLDVRGHDFRLRARSSTHSPTVRCGPTGNQLSAEGAARARAKLRVRQTMTFRALCLIPMAEDHRAELGYSAPFGFFKCADAHQAPRG